MSFADKFHSVIFIYFLSSLSYICEILCILSVIFIMISFLGVKGEVTRKTFIPGFIYIRDSECLRFQQHQGKFEKTPGFFIRFWRHVLVQEIDTGSKQFIADKTQHQIPIISG